MCNYDVQLSTGALGGKKKGGKERFDYSREEGNVTVETEIKVMQPEAKECSQPLDVGRGKQQILLWSL